MQNTTLSAIEAMERTAQYQSSLINLAENCTCEHKKRRLYKAALKAKKATETIKEILSTHGLTA